MIGVLELQNPENSAVGSPLSCEDGKLRKYRSLRIKRT